MLGLLVLLARARGADARGVRVVLLGVQPLVDHDVLEGEVHEAAVAAHVVGVVAGDELLLGEGDQLARGDSVHPLDRAGVGEGPAGAALALVLHVRHGALLAPVDGAVGHRVGVLEALRGEARGVADAAQAGHRLELLRGEVRELVEAEPVGVVLGVVGVDALDVGGKGRKAARVLLRVVGLTVLLRPGPEEVMGRSVGARADGPRVRVGGFAEAPGICRALPRPGGRGRAGAGGARGAARTPGRATRFPSRGPPPAPGGPSPLRRPPGSRRPGSSSPGCSRS